jgi:signal peptidase II
MPKFSPDNKIWNILFFVSAFFVLALDQLSKAFVRSNMALGQSIPESGFFRFTYVENTGAAFSIFHGRASLLAIFSFAGALLILAWVFIFAKKYPELDTPLNKIALGIILGGTLGNFIDRAVIGRVTDFLDVGPWPVFNLADSAVVVGVIIFAISILFVHRKSDPQHVKQ